MKERTSLAHPGQPEPSRPSWRDRWRARAAKPAVPLITWLVLWIPISFLFPLYHVHLPIPPLMMPACFFLFLSDQTVPWLSVVAPAAVFWIGATVTSVIAILRYRAMPYRQR